MQLLSHTPGFDVESASRIAEKMFGRRARARMLPSERDQNFLLTDEAGEKFVLKIANALELRELLRSEEHTSELQSQSNLVCRLLLEKKKKKKKEHITE